MAEQHVLLICDIVDSTALTEQLGDARAATVFSEHDRVARTLLRTWHGREIDKSDGLLALFDAAGDAAGFAAEYHLALAKFEIPMAARAAVHCGPLVLRENSADAIAYGAKPLEVEGLAKPTVARLAALASAGQTLLSAAAWSTIDATNYPALPLGHWRLKGIEAPLEVFAIDDGTSVVPSDSEKATRVERHGDFWLPVRRVAHSLPSERDDFIGRGPILSDLIRQLAGGARQISLVGPGGGGKTRLAQRLGWASLVDFPGGVWFCDLSQATTDAGILHAVAQGLEVPLGLGDPTQQLGHAIAGRDRCLVVLDNFEQVSRYAERTVGRWLERAPSACFVVTTREVLGIVGEHAVEVPALSGAEGSALFMRRAAAAVNGFQPEAAERAAILTLVELLDGLPLAIELAASRIRLMAPSRMVARIGERFKLLVSDGGRSERQATMRATLDWSWGLLSDDERTALAQLSSFEGGFTLEAAEAVLDLGSGAAAPWPAGVVQALVEKSLVRVGRGYRFELLRTVQDYAQSRLAETGGAEAAQARHWRHFATYDDEIGTDAPEAELENLIAAARAAWVGGQPGASISSLASAWSILKRVGPFEVAAELAHGLVSSVPAGTLAAGRAGLIEACARGAAGQTREAIVLLRRALADAPDDTPTHALLLCSLAEMLGGTGLMVEAGDCLSQSLELAGRLGSDTLVRRALNERGAWLMRQSRLREARVCYQEAHELARRHVDGRWEGGVLGNLGVIEHLMGDADAARQHYEAALELFNTAANRVWEGNTRCNLGQLHQEQGREEDARREFERSLDIARHVGHRRLECTVSCNIGLLHDRERRYDEAVGQFRNSAAVARSIDDPRAEGQSLGYLGLALARTPAHAEAMATFASALELLSRIGDPISLGLLQCAIFEAAKLHGDHLAMAGAARGAIDCLRQSDGGERSQLAQKMQSIGIAPVGTGEHDAAIGPD